ncbi:hypothetical protein JMJ35_003194 [Cladonia borealis]|uniref:Ketoreductase domain-containing protein n=1 Tax=Cladonia borealis TaxID=184061 RepID=A0AA39R491_9LECA|nr:hypothetical protein JMJ35_003194 [Cladonia borealis]
MQNGHTTDNAPKGKCRLDGKVALVTGAGRGVGKGIALELGSRGAYVVVNYSKSATPAESVVSELCSLGTRAIAIQADISQPAEIAALFSQALAHFGRLDLVISNAGMEAFQIEEDVTQEDFDRVFNLNTRGQFFVAQNGLKHCAKGGRIILTSSIAASMSGVKNHALYAGSKAAVEGFTRSFAEDCGPKKITVNAIAPGGIMTDMFAENSWHYAPGATQETGTDVTAKGVASLCPLGRVGMPQDIARVVAFLCGDESEWINGQVLKLTGGSSA